MNAIHPSQHVQRWDHVFGFVLLFMAAFLAIGDATATNLPTILRLGGVGLCIYTVWGGLRAIASDGR